ncbi:MAG: sulfur carrier protein ThiS [Actinobacteria bacterium]|nr:sulfur carrier protein ThiS [Actinomycetota bacterium]
MVTVNGLSQAFPSEPTVADVVSRALGVAATGVTGVAVAVDDRVVPRSRWELTTVSPGARIELVTATQGG